MYNASLGGSPNVSVPRLLVKTMSFGLVTLRHVYFALRLRHTCFLRNVISSLVVSSGRSIGILTRPAPHPLFRLGWSRLTHGNRLVRPETSAILPTRGTA